MPEAVEAPKKAAENRAAARRENPMEKVRFPIEFRPWLTSLLVRFVFYHRENVGDGR